MSFILINIFSFYYFRLTLNNTGGLMRINNLQVSKYKNLKNINIDFTNSHFALIIGNNGSGKSNLLEAIVLLFSNLYKHEKPIFEFSIDYELFDGRKINIKSDLDDWYKIKVNNKEISMDQLRTLTKDPSTSILPHNILVYYSGHLSRLEKFMEFSIAEYISSIRKDIRQPRHFFYMYPSYFPMALLSILGNGFEVESRIKETLNIQEINSFSIKIDKKNAKYIKFLTTFINVLKKFSVEVTENSKESIFHFDGISSLKNIIENRVVGYDRDLFKFLDIAYCTGVLKEVKVNCLLQSGEIISDFEFSEGEQQFLIVNAMIEFFGYKDTLYLFDEPDTYYHPDWQREFLNHLRDAGVETQFLITTHSPLMLSSIQEENIYIINKGQVFTKESNGSLGRDANGILSEIMGIPERPKNVNDLIRSFYRQVEREDISDAEESLKLLKNKISINDPFLTEAESILLISKWKDS